MSEDSDDKSFDPSEQKLRKARAEGDIPRLTELTVAAMYVGAFLALGALAGFLVPRWLSLAGHVLSGQTWRSDEVLAAADSLGSYGAMGAMAITGLPGLAILLVLVAMRQIVFAPRKLALDPKRLNPVANAKQKFGRQGLGTFLMSLAKAASVSAGGWLLFTALLDDIVSSQRTGMRWTGDLNWILGRVLVLATVISIIFAGFDIFWKRHEHRRRNRMSRKEVQDEHKESEGDPHLKASRRQRAIDYAMKQMLSDVEKADVLIVNPTHYAVALQWNRGTGRAPVCLAKGVDEVAARIRARAEKNKIPVWSDPPCARAIHATIDIGQEIGRDQFAAVAAAIRFAEQMRKKARAGW